MKTETQPYNFCYIVDNKVHTTEVSATNKVEAKRKIIEMHKGKTVHSFNRINGNLNDLREI